mmetsp:Transcript_43796/g.110806  ORF Transcript_43796/g.110806 Transcript_43796/m.110806 type:complete len:599 (-) Transcript_43796:177-1973(-)
MAGTRAGLSRLASTCRLLAGYQCAAAARLGQNCTFLTGTAALLTTASASLPARQPRMPLHSCPTASRQLSSSAAAVHRKAPGYWQGLQQPGATGKAAAGRQSGRSVFGKEHVRSPPGPRPPRDSGGDSGNSNLGASGGRSHRQWRHGVKSHKHQRSAKAQHVAINQRIRAARSVGALLAVEQAEGLRALSPLNVDTLLARLQATAPRPGSAHAAHASSLLRRLKEYLTSGMAGYPAPTLVSCLQRLAALTPLPAMLLKAVEVEVGRRASRRQFRVSELTQLVRLGAAEAKRVAAQAKQAPPTADTAEHQVAPASHAAVVAAFLPAFAELERRLASSSVALPLESLVDMSRAYSAVAYHSLPLLGALEAALDAPVDLSSLEAATLVGVMHQLASTPGHSPELLSAIAGAVSARVGDLKPGELADAAHAAALAGDTSSSVAESGGLMAAIAARATAPRLYALDSEKLARLSVALAAAGQLTAAASITVQRCAVRQLEEFDAADLGRLLWAVAVSSGADAESGELFACAEGRLVSLVPLMDGNTLAGAAWAYAAVGQTAGRSLRRAIDERAVEMYNDVDCLERKMVTDALAAMVPPEECSH